MPEKTLSVIYTVITTVITIKSIIRIINHDFAVVYTNNRVSDIVFNYALLLEITPHKPTMEKFTFTGFIKIFMLHGRFLWRV